MRALYPDVAPVCSHIDDLVGPAGKHQMVAVATEIGALDHKSTPLLDIEAGADVPGAGGASG